jgi:hypothetical protein
MHAVPLAWLTPLRRLATLAPRGTLRRNVAHVLVKAASRGRKLSREIHEIRPVDRPDLCFAASDSMVMDAV